MSLIPSPLDRSLSGNASPDARKVRGLLSVLDLMIIECNGDYILKVRGLLSVLDLMIIECNDDYTLSTEVCSHFPVGF